MNGENEMNLITLKSLETTHLESIIDIGIRIKQNPEKYEDLLNGRSLYMLFEKTSTRTALSFGLGFNELGGRYFMQRWQDSNFTVGEIADEYEETPTEPIKQIDHNTIEADARTYIDDLNDKFDLNLPEDEDYETVGGFVFSCLGYIPKANESFDYENLKFTIASAEARKIKRIKIQKISEQ